MTTMTPRQRVEATLRHEEPDRVPFDIGGGPTTGIHERALRGWMRLRGRTDADQVRITNVIQQLGTPPPDFWIEIGQDVWPLGPNPPASYRFEEREQGDYTTWIDEWGVGWRMPKGHGLYYDMMSHPLREAESLEQILDFNWPDGGDPSRVAGMKSRVQEIRETAGDVAIFCSTVGAGIYETTQWLRSMQNVFMDMVARPEWVTAIFDKVLEVKKAYWSNVIAEVGDEITVFFEADDFAGQDGNLVRPELYVELLKPRHQELVSHIKKQKPDAFVFLHSCGSVVDLLPHFIAAGFDAINPVQVSAKGMDTARLKAQFGDRITFWGGGVDTQQVLPRGTPAEVKKEVRKRMADLKPGGGFVFSAVHNIQPDVPAENIEAMYQAYRECANYD